MSGKTDNDWVSPMCYQCCYFNGMNQTNLITCQLC